MKKQFINLKPMRNEIRDMLLAQLDKTTFMNTSRVDLSVDVGQLIESKLKEKEIVEPTICITPNAYIKMRQLIDKTSTEIGWYGTVTKMEGLESTYLIDDILVYPQTVTGATCVQDDDKMFDFEMELTTDQVNHKRFHGHSHVNMGVTPSGVDEQFYQDVLTQVHDFFIIVITNKRNEYTVRFYDMENNIMYSEVPIHVILDDGTMLTNWYEDSKNKLTEHVYQTTTTTTRPSEHVDSYKFRTNTSAHNALVQKTVYDYLDDEEELETYSNSNIVYDKYYGYLDKETAARYRKLGLIGSNNETSSNKFKKQSKGRR